jgi:hypothetical protein
VIADTLAALALLVGPVLVPSLALLGARPMTLFLMPLVGAILAAVAAELEAALGGTILTWFVILAVAANGAALVSLRGRLIGMVGLRQRGDRLRVEGDGDRPRSWSVPSAWSCITVVVIGLAVLWPLQALRSPILAYDGFAIWTLHSLFIYGGHGVYQSALTNPAYRFSNPNYPPLVPATGALGFVAQGGVDLRLAVVMTAVLNACALGAAGCAIVATVDAIPRALPRLSALVAGACVCLIGFGLSGVYGVGGYADLLWAASAVAAVVIGLVLPPSTRNLAAAWVCATTAGLTKPEGFITACMILLLLAVRYVKRPAHSPWSTLDRAQVDRRVRLAWPGWAARVSLLTIVMALPGLFWLAYVRYKHIGSDFVGTSGQSVGLRFRSTVPAVWANLHIVPLAAAVAVVAAVFLSRRRRRLALANDLWLWIVVVGSLAALLITYVFGALEIHWWLSTSANRTTIFEGLACYADLALWLVVATSYQVKDVESPDVQSAEPITDAFPEPLEVAPAVLETRA